MDFDTMTEPQLEHLAAVSAAAATAVAYGGGDDLIVLRRQCPEIPGEQNDDGARVAAAIDILLFLVEAYTEDQKR